MLAFAFLAASAPLRIASLNLCTDEYLLLLARPDQLVSVSYLSQEPQESPLWQTARRYRGNRGSLEDVLASRPNLILTMGGGGRATSLLANRLNIRSVDLPNPESLADVANNLRIVAGAIGNLGAADPWIKKLRLLQASVPPNAIDAVWVSGGGQSLAPDSLGAQWLRLAGYRQRALPNARLTLEAMLTSPPKTLIVSNYRSGQMSSGQQWLSNPIIRRSPSRKLATDGRPWTCLGPLMIPEIKRLRGLPR